MSHSSSDYIKLPAYSDIIYGAIYNDMSKSKLYDKGWFVKLRSLWQYDKLVSSTLREIKMNQKVLQLGATFGNQIDRVAERVGAYGFYDVIDVNANQIERCKGKYANAGYPALNLIHQDATNLQVDDKYDVVLCFMLLQELPIVSKKKAINAALSAVRDGGSVIFVDYHNPIFWHPLRYIVRMLNRLFNPFVEKLWDRDIETFANNRTDFTWRKNTYFGRMFQKLVVSKKMNPLEELKPTAEDDNPFAPVMILD